MLEKRIRKELSYYANLIYNRNLVSAAGGNISYKLDIDRYLVSPTNSCLGNIRPGEFVIVNSMLELIKGIKKPSKETKMHIAIYREREDIKCVMHTHSPYATSFSIEGRKIPMVTASARVKLIDVPIIDYADPGSEELSRLMSSKISKIIDRRINCFLLKKHGVICFSKSIKVAFNIAELCENTAKISYLSKSFKDDKEELRIKKIYDLSQSIYNKMTKYALDPDVSISPFRTFKRDGFNLLEIKSGLHIGTHVDAPKHQLDTGKGIDDIPLKSCMGYARVFNILKKGKDTPIVLNDIDISGIEKDLIVLLYTGWDRFRGTVIYYENPPYISEELANILVSRDIKAIGVDMPSIDSFTKNGPISHRIFLKRNIPVIEGLINLDRLIARRFFFMGLPLNIRKGDGSPIRAVGIELY